MQRNYSPKISVVIPVYGSEAILPELTSQISEVMLSESWKYEIVYVCDQSPDQSWAVITSLVDQFPSVQGILLRVNAGQHNALLAGLAQASGDLVVTMDDDLQHSPADIPSLVSKITKEGFDVAYAKFSKRKHPLWKILGSGLNNAIASYLIKKPADLYMSPFRAFPAAIKDEIVAYKGPFVYVDGIILTITRHISSVHVHHHERHNGRSRYGLRKSVSLLLRMATGFSIVPLRITSILGLVTSGLGFLAALIFVIQKFTVDIMPDGWSSLMVAILVVGGMNLMSMGMLGEYLGRVLLTLNGRKQYIISGRVGESRLEDTE
jgi:undecaprenyl-phosphate 4-deoxy-4-formamido-L-arabinose transferase